jgi:NADH dehydrogenase
VRALVHSRAQQQDVDFLRSLKAEIAVADLRGGNEDLKRALAGVKTVFHLVGSIAPRKGEKLEDLHAGQTKALLSAARKAGVEKVVLITALGTDPHAHSAYHRTKWQSEDALRQSEIAHVILRPSLIVGRQVGRRDSKLVSRYIDLIHSRPAVPLLGGGNNSIQPIFIGDLVTAMIESIATDRYDGRAYELGGGEVMTMRQFVKALMTALEIEKPFLSVPLPLAGALAAVLEAVQDRPTVSIDQVRLSAHDNICQNNALTANFGIEPTKLTAALDTYRQNSKSKETANASGARS